MIDQAEFRLYLTFKESAKTRRKYYPDGEPSYTSSDLNVEFLGLHRNPPQDIFFYHSEEVTEYIYNQKELYLCVVRYSDSDTFGYTSGLWQVVSICDSYREAEASLERALKVSLEDVMTQDPYSDNYYHPPWLGFTSKFEGKEIHKLKVQN